MEQATQLDWATLEREAERVVRVVAPEIGDTPTYIVAVQSTDLGSGLGGTRGATGPALDLMVRSFVRWVGRGLALVYDRDAFVSADDFMSMILHEVGHWLDGDYLSAIKSPPCAIFAQHSHAAFYIAVSEVSRLSEPSVVSDTHGPGWLRTVCHLRHRCAWQCDWSLPIVDVAGYMLDSFSARPYDLHSVLLRSGEYERCEQMSFAEIVRQPMPAALEF